MTRAPRTVSSSPPAPAPAPPDTSTDTTRPENIEQTLSLNESTSRRRWQRWGAALLLLLATVTVSTWAFMRGNEAVTYQTPVLFTIARDLTQMELHVDVDEADVGEVKAGQSATFTVDAYPGRTLPAGVTKVYYASKTVSGVVPSRAS